MTRKKRKTRSRQERKRVYLRTRQTWNQALRRQIEAHWKAMWLSEGASLWRRLTTPLITDAADRYIDDEEFNQ